MANIDIHEKQAKSNFDLLKTILLKTSFRDWQITVAFYTAIHIFECQLTKKNPDWREGRMMADDPDSPHVWRGLCINSNFRDLMRNYRMLEIRSRTARYLENTAGDKIAKDYLTTEDTNDCINNHLKKILEKFNYNW